MGTTEASPKLNPAEDQRPGGSDRPRGRRVMIASRAKQPPPAARPDAVGRRGNRVKLAAQRIKAIAEVELPRYCDPLSRPRMTS